VFCMGNGQKAPKMRGMVEHHKTLEVSILANKSELYAEILKLYVSNELFIHIKLLIPSAYNTIRDILRAI